MNKLLSTLLLIAFAFNSFCQTCLYKNLSVRFNFKTEIKKMMVGQYNDSAIVKITIIDKIDETKNQLIVYSTCELHGNEFQECASVRSYITKYNAKSEILDNNFGDLIVADLNFDGKEDFAIKRESGGNGGPLYNYYIQKNGKFILDKFLTEKMGYFPDKINKQIKTLTTLVHAGALWLGETTYKYEPRDRRWKKVKHRLVSY